MISRPRLSDYGSLAAAIWGVASSPPMNDYDTYVDRVKAQFPELAGTNTSSTLRIRPARLVTALISFVDDYDRPPPTELFAVDLARELLVRFDELAQQGTNLDVRAQLAVAEQHTTRFQAALALHTATRVLARGRDNRLHPEFDLTLDRRLEIGRVIQPFPSALSKGGDPLGDTYHYWANFVVGLYVAYHEGQPHAAALQALFYAGPWLMSTVRERMFGNTLFFGNHKHIDRLGFRRGRAMAHAGADSSIGRAQATSGSERTSR